MTRLAGRWLASGLVGCALAAPVASATAQTPAAAPAEPGFEDALPPGRSLDDRLAEIQRRVRAALVYPPLARRRALEGEALVAFSVGPRGIAQEVALARSSGHAILDRAAERAVRDARGLPAVYGRLEVPVQFVLRAAP